MIIAIALLALVVVFLAQKPVSGSDGAPLPNPTAVPATGTDGIPSPAKWQNPIAGTEAGQVVMDANPSLAENEPLVGPPPMPGSNVFKGTALSQPDLTAKELIPQPGMKEITSARRGSAFTGYRKL